VIAPERPPSQTPAKLELVIFVGLQASGKTAFYRERFAESHAHVSKDNFPNHPRPQRRQMALLRETLAAGRSAVVDNTNPSAEIREPLIKLGREFGARIVGYGFESDLRACLERNARREGKARVPRDWPARRQQPTRDAALGGRL
jgi:predicted kinase